jgi:hypothetical protein
MARHGIDMALLAAAQPGVDEIGATRVEVADPYSAGKARLLGWTASALRCRAVLHELRGPRHRGRGRIGAVTVFGFASDRERVEVLFTSLLLQAQTQLVAQRPPHPDESVAAYRRSWLHGFAVRVHRRLVEAERRAEERAGQVSADGPGVARRRGAGARGPAQPGGAGLRRGVPRSRPGQAVGVVGQRVRAGAAAGDAADLGAGALHGRPCWRRDVGAAAFRHTLRRAASRRQG